MLCSEPDEHILVSLLSPSLWLPAACCLIAACCLLPAAYLLPRLVPPLPPQSPDPGASTSNRVLTVHVRVLARLAGRGRWYSPVWYLPWMVASVSPYASPSPPAACFAPPCHAFCHRRLQLCSTSVGEPPPCVHVRAQHALAARTSVHELLPSIHSYSTLTPPCNQHLPIADCLVSPSSMYFLALAPLPIRSLAIHCYQLPAGLLAIPQLSLVAVSSALCFTITACTLPRSLR